MLGTRPIFTRSKECRGVAHLTWSTEKKIIKDPRRTGLGKLTFCKPVCRRMLSSKSLRTSPRMADKTITHLSADCWLFLGLVAGKSSHEATDLDQYLDFSSLRWMYPASRPMKTMRSYVGLV